MASATIQVQVLHGSGPSLASAEGGVVWNRKDDESNTDRIPVPPAAPGSNYSNYKSFKLVVTVVGTTSISNIGVRKNAAEPSGSKLFYGTVGAYAQCTGTAAAQGNRPADSTSALAASPDPNTPASYTVVPTSFVMLDAGPYSTTTTGAKGSAIPICVGVSSAYAGGADSAAPQSSLIFQYSEA